MHGVSAPRPGQEQAADPPKLPTRAWEGEWQDVGLEIEEAKPNFFGRFGRRGSGNRGTVASQPATIPAAPEADVPLADVELGGGSTTQRNSVPPELPSAAPAASAAAEAGRISQREAPPSSKVKQQDAGSSADPPPNKPAGGVWSKAAAAAKGLKREIQIAKAAALVTVEQVKEAEKQEEKPRKRSRAARIAAVDGLLRLYRARPPGALSSGRCEYRDVPRLSRQISVTTTSGVRDADGRLAREDDVTLAPGQPDTRLVDARQPIGHRGGRNRHPEAGRDGDQVLQAWQVAPRKVHTRGG